MNIEKMISLVSKLRTELKKYPTDYNVEFSYISFEQNGAAYTVEIPITRSSETILVSVSERKPWIPVNDGWGIIGYDFTCPCGYEMKFARTGDECSKCDREITEIDPDDK